jgi:hypothetical protein
MKRVKTVCIASLLLTCIFSLNLKAQWVECQVPQASSIFEVYANGTQIFAGLTTGLFVSSDNGTNWLPSSEEFVGTNVRCIERIGSAIFLSNNYALYRSLDNGENWEEIGDGLDLAQVRCITNKGNSLFAGTDNGVFRSTNNGSDWTAVNTGLQEFLAINDIAVVGSNLFAGSNFYGMFLSTNNGGSWKAINNGLKSNFTVTSLAVINNNLFAASSDGVAISTNNGTSWKYVNSGIEFASVKSLVVVGRNLFSGSNTGVFVTTNNGNSWVDVNAGLSKKSTVSLSVNNTHIFAGISTLGGPERSVWRRPLSEMINTNSVQPLPISTISSTVYPNPFTNSTTISYTLPKRDMVAIEVFDILGRKIQTLANEVMDAGLHSVVFHGENLPLGMYTVKITSGASSEEMKVVLSK